MDLFRSKIADGLRKLRTAKNFSQEYVAEHLGKADYTGYQRIESGRTELKFEDAYKLSQLYRVPMEVIFNPDLVDNGNLTSHPIKNTVEVTVSIDGTEENLMAQIDTLKAFNDVLNKKKF
jgi:transcriptional regulator with XRE-family HTH domain